MDLRKHEEQILSVESVCSSWETARELETRLEALRPDYWETLV